MTQEQIERTKPTHGGDLDARALARSLAWVAAAAGDFAGCSSVHVR